jgi:hypothetical protein
VALAEEDDDDEDDDADSVTSSATNGATNERDDDSVVTSSANTGGVDVESMECDGEYTYETKEEERQEEEVKEEDDEEDEDEDEDEEFDPVAAVLAQLGFDEYLPAFHREKILLEQLPELDDSDLKELGVHLGPRKRMLRVFKQVYVGDNVAAKPSAVVQKAAVKKAVVKKAEVSAPNPLGESDWLIVPSFDSSVLIVTGCRPTNLCTRPVNVAWILYIRDDGHVRIRVPDPLH